MNFSENGNILIGTTSAMNSIIEEKLELFEELKLLILDDADNILNNPSTLNIFIQMANTALAISNGNGD